MLIDEFLPIYDAVERHQIQIQAPAAATYKAVRELDLSESAVVQALVRLRDLPSMFRRNRLSAECLGIQELIAGGFILLGERSNQEVLLGLVGRFWTPHGDIQRIDVEQFRVFGSPGYAKAAWNFSLSECSDDVTTLATETRVLCLDAASRVKFKVYWTVIAPFSGHIRKEALRTIKRAAEAQG
jgi:hypothetical protein